MAIEIVSCPIKNGDFPISYVNAYQRVDHQGVWRHFPEPCHDRQVESIGAKPSDRWLTLSDVGNVELHLGTWCIPNVPTDTDTVVINKNMVGGLEHEIYFPIIFGNVIIPTDEVHHFSEGLKHTTSQESIIILSYYPIIHHIIYIYILPLVHHPYNIIQLE